MNTKTADTLETYIIRLCRALGTGLAGSAAAGPIFGQPTCAKIPYELRCVVHFLLKQYTSRDLGR